MQTLLIIIEVVIIIFAATLGTFIWKHGSDIFNSGKRWECLKEELKKYRSAYLTILVVCIFLTVVLFLRFQLTEDIATKEDLLNTKTEIINELKNSDSQRYNELVNAINNLIAEMRAERVNGTEPK